MDEVRAPGGPGIEPHWTRSSKDGVGTSASEISKVWFSLAKGVITELYYPSIDKANTRQIEFIITQGDFVSYEKYDTSHTVEYVAPGIPAYKVTTLCKEGRYRLTKWVYNDIHRDSLVIRTSFEPLKGPLESFRLFCYVTPHIDNGGYHNKGWIGDYKGTDMLFAERNGINIAVGTSNGFGIRTCGFVGVNDGWTQLKKYGRIQEIYTRADDGNIGLIGEIPLIKPNFVVAVGFGHGHMSAGQMCKATLLSDAHLLLDKFKAEWEQLYLNLRYPSHESEELENFFRTSVMVIKCHRTKLFSGSIIASLSIPWGRSVGDNNLGGYHLIWPRDLVESAAGLLAAGDGHGAREILFYLMCTQDADGHWPQCMWVTGEPYWTGIQMDETAMPVLLARALATHDQLYGLDPTAMIEKAVRFIVQNGPVTEEDRWEENGGYTPFTLASEIAALVTSAVLFERSGNHKAAKYVLETADCWNSMIERWIYVKDTPLAKEVGVEGYYIRIAPDPSGLDVEPTKADFHLKNIPWDRSQVTAEQIVSCDALALVRYGLRSADDPHILNTVKVIDHLLKIETKCGPAWHRYNGDGYGEHADGAPYNGTGIGRGWPLLVAERAHYELAKGDSKRAWQLLSALIKQTNRIGFLPEQIWDGPDIPEMGLYNGRPSGSAMPLVWAHSEYIRLFRSLSEERVFDLFEVVHQRYVKEKTTSNMAVWRFNHKTRRISQNQILRVEGKAAFILHYTFDGWKSAQDAESVDSTLGLWYVDLHIEGLSPGSQISFTFYWTDHSSWEEENFDVTIAQGAVSS